MNDLLARAMELDAHGELLDPNSKSEAINVDDNAPSWPRVEAMLERFAQSEIHHLIDIKINSLRCVSPQFVSPALPPPLFDLFRKHNAKIIHLRRHPAHQFVSSIVAKKTGFWHPTSDENITVEKVHVDFWSLKNFIVSCAVEDGLIETWCDGFAALNLEYDYVFGEQNFAETIFKAAEFMGVKLKPDWAAVQPIFKKIIHESFEGSISNFEEIRHLLPMQHDTIVKNRRSDSKVVINTVFQEPFLSRIKLRIDELRGFTSTGVLPIDCIKGKAVLDWECGDGAFTAALGSSGAASVIAVDTWLDIEKISAELKSNPKYHFSRRSLSDSVTDLEGMMDLVFANTVTEHMKNLSSDFEDVRKVLKPNGYFFINHDNYFQPVGSHDHGFLNYGDGGIVPQGPDCWNKDTKCASSESHRQNVSRNFPWTWDERNEKTKNPLNCAACHYFKRSQPWAHLVYQDEFSTLFPQPSFSTGKNQSSLNKVTIFQLRQCLIEAGFEIIEEARDTVPNEPPAQLRCGLHQFTETDLKTTMYKVLARRNN